MWCNNNENSYDGGDCCLEDPDVLCWDGGNPETCDCIDPNHKPITTTTTLKPTDCNHMYIADGFCDGFLNNEENCFDGGDCCLEEPDLTNCDDDIYVCDCIDPNHNPDCSDTFDHDSPKK